jgi:hypothetical protein
MLLIAVAMSGVALAQVPAAPEIDPSSSVTALALISGALLVIRGRHKR